jgi:hypothetical protein
VAVEREPTINDVHAAWVSRTAAIEFVEITCEIVTTVIGDGVEGKPRERLNPFAKAIPTTDRVLKATAEYAYENGKTAIKKSSDIIPPDDPDTIAQQIFHAAFDGKTNASYVKQAGYLTMGDIERSSTPSPRVATNLDFLAVSLWIEPSRVLKDSGWSVGRMSLEKDLLETSGILCRRIRVPRGPRLTGAIDADPKRDWTPVRWQTWADGKPSTVVTIGYRHDEGFGPVVSEWEITRYNEAGRHESTSRGRVIRYDLNRDIDDSSFTVKFPVGTHVVEKWRNRNRYYIQMPNDLLVPIKESDFGSREPLASGPQRESLSKP